MLLLKYLGLIIMFFHLHHPLNLCLLLFDAICFLNSDSIFCLITGKLGTTTSKENSSPLIGSIPVSIIV